MRRPWKTAATAAPVHRFVIRRFCELDMDLKLKWDGNTGDGKRAFVVAESNDGWQDLRIEVDTDDCDSEFAKAAMQEVIDRVNAANDDKA